MEWSAGAVAGMLGIAPTTLRTWDRRYGLGPSTRHEGKHRRYNEDDVARLKRMVELTGAGVAPASAAASLVAEGDDLDFVAAAERLDAAGMRRVAAALIARHGVVHTWDAVLAPFLVELGERVASTAAGVEVEHVASGSIADAMRTSGVSGGTPAVLLACAPDEQHSLPLDVLAAALAEKDCVARNLGARVPADALVSAVRLLMPRVVLVWAHDRTYADQVPLADLADVPVLVAGPGWQEVPLPGGVRAVDTLETAVETILSRI
ncbi:MerR HTH family regulatory protein [Lentzea xinjiangensis]|uniref:MerR HTH family regulatory protein n=1 Tax=Lentzea xinjiangensis TaxID=402600 RepID=A0A1H9TWJ7_9PSEU|nr:MerR family transcriptional regulator [Lentzea xinjiangensis]SES01740.1 MerR HTH family regulatory protein [Lentzea xinjiangensis]